MSYFSFSSTLSDSKRNTEFCFSVKMQICLQIILSFHVMWISSYNHKTAELTELATSREGKYMDL